MAVQPDDPEQKPVDRNPHGPTLLSRGESGMFTRNMR